MAIFSLDDLVYRLRLLCEHEGGQYQWATKHKLSPQYVSDVLRGKRMPGPALLTAMKMEKMTLYTTKAGT